MTDHGKILQTNSNLKFNDYKLFLRLRYNLRNNITLACVDKRSLKIRVDKYEEEFEFAKQLWNRVNNYLFNYIDLIIMVDILEILFATHNQKKSMSDFDAYVENISKTTEITAKDFGRNLKNNSNYIWLKAIEQLEISEQWSTSKIFSVFK
jgi:hypothetical protein